jgi:O-acetyl-ADP-ribose deacetylase (regulator of RNase III)
MVGKVLNSVGGLSYVAACSQHTNIGTGDIATTIGGNLPCHYVIHAVCCGWNAGGVAEQVSNIGSTNCMFLCLGHSKVVHIQAHLLQHVCMV